jgi:uncharacterized membrane protein
MTSMCSVVRRMTQVMSKVSVCAVALAALVSASPIGAHNVKHGGTIFNYDKLRSKDGKTDCCDQKHCQPASAWWYDHEAHAWKFVVRFGTAAGSSGAKNAGVEVSVPESDVTFEDLQGKGVAHWCGEFFGGENVYYQNRCAFVPLKTSYRVLPALLAGE